jgi:hypothetical protein
MLVLASGINQESAETKTYENETYEKGYVGS